MKKVNKKATKYTVVKFCPKCGKKTTQSLFNKEDKSYRCHICGTIS